MLIKLFLSLQFYLLHLLLNSCDGNDTFWCQVLCSWNSPALSAGNTGFYLSRSVSAKPFWPKSGWPQNLGTDARLCVHCTRHLSVTPATWRRSSLHNTSATRELSVYLDGQRLRHECHPTYFGATLDRTLSYREHSTKTAGKLKNRNNLIMKLPGSTWAPTLCSHMATKSTR